MKQFRKWLYHTIFESETIEGKLFDIRLLILILMNFAFVMFESIQSINALYGSSFYIIEWILTVLFTVEYSLRLYSVPSRKKFVVSFYGIIDFLAVFPFYICLFFPALHFLGAVRVLRLLRIFRIFNLVHFLEEGNVLMESLWKSRRKIILFLFFVLLLTVILGSVMYVIENEQNEAFSSIPQSIYWAIVTLTTVGYGDIAPLLPSEKWSLRSF